MKNRQALAGTGSIVSYLTAWARAGSLVSRRYIDETVYGFYRNIKAAVLHARASEPGHYDQRNTIEDIFSAYGSVESTRTVKDRDTDGPRGIAFIEMKDEAERRRPSNLWMDSV